MPTLSQTQSKVLPPRVGVPARPMRCHVPSVHGISSPPQRILARGRSICDVPSREYEVMRSGPTNRHHAPTQGWRTRSPRRTNLGPRRGVSGGVTRLPGSRIHKRESLPAHGIVAARKPPSFLRYPFFFRSHSLNNKDEVSRLHGPRPVSLHPGAAPPPPPDSH